MGQLGKAGLCLAGVVVALALPGVAQAFCGFYVASAEEDLVNNATVVVMMREGTTTVLSMQNDYQGPTEDFAMVVPVPVVLQEDNVKTLDREVFERVNRLAAPRLVEYWEQDPCNQGTIGLGGLGTIGHGGGGGAGSGYGRGAGGFVRVEAEFAVGEYDIVILSSNDSSALDTWLRAHHYRIPDGAEAVLRPYVEQGMKFFVAKVDADRAHFEDGHAVLSPLRFHYEDESFRLPVRLGLLNSPGKQDLVVHVLARNQRYEVANYGNVTIPTNIEVADEVRQSFGPFYAALLDRTLEHHPGAVVTEYSWQATGCDPCPGPVLSASDLMTLGADVALGSDAASAQSLAARARVDARVVGNMSREIVDRIARRHLNEVRFCYQQGFNRRSDLQGTVPVRFELDTTGGVKDAALEDGTLDDDAVRQCILAATRRWRFPSPEGGTDRINLTFRLDAVPTGRSYGVPGPYQSFVLTRLHYRYEKDGLDEDLVFRAADPIVGGREMMGDDGKLESGAQPASTNNFQGRYVIRHRWDGPVECDDPVRGVWGGPPAGTEGDRSPLAAPPTARVDTASVQLASLVREDVPSLDLVAGAAQPAAAQAPQEEREEPAEPASTPPARSDSSGGCAGCAVAGGDAGLATLLLAPLLVLLGRRRRRRG